MSEYEYVVGFGYKPPNAGGDVIKEEIVRCRDCRFSLAHGNGCGRNQDIYDAEPDGFCKWGERKEDGK